MREEILGADDDLPYEAASASFAHQINNPLAVIFANLDYAIEKLESSPELAEAAEALREALEAAGRIRDLVSRRVSVPSTPDAAPQAGSPVKARVLVVDDEVALGRGLRRALADCDVEIAADGAEALRRIEGGERFDVILCDLMMPGMQGFDVYAELRRLAPEQSERMVFMTGGATTTRAQEFVASVPNTVLQKPVAAQRLREVIRERVG